MFLEVELEEEGIDDGAETEALDRHLDNDTTSSLAAVSFERLSDLEATVTSGITWRGS